MSLISDPDFITHSIRLQYLRNVEDPYGPRLISFDPSYRANPYVVDAGLADVERWPELAMPSSPAPSDDEGGGPHRRAFGFPGATGLKYTTTIMGPSRAGALGIRTSGKRSSVADVSRLSLRRSVSLPRHTNGKAEKAQPEPDTTPTLPASASPRATVVTEPLVETETTASDAQTDTKAAQGASSAPQLNFPIPFIPKFKGAAEMEERRRLRMRNRLAPNDPAVRPQVSAPATLNPELSLSSSSSSSSESVSDVEEQGVLADEDDEDEFDDDVVDDMDDDEFDPEFAASRGTILDDTSDGLSLLSGSQSMTSASDFSVTHSSLPPASSARNNSQRLSPVHENHVNEEKSMDATPERMTNSEKIDSYFEMVTTAPTGSSRAPVTKTPAFLNVPPSSLTHTIPSPSPSMFTRLPVPGARPGKSALTAMLASSNDDTSENPFTELYSAISGRSDSESMTVRVFFPHAREPAGQAMGLNVRKDATIEEVLGFALWTYWEEGWLPKIDEGLEGEDDPKWLNTCSALGWILRIAEEDGEVDEDFPPPDRTGKISRFSFDAYAVLEASPAQVQQNKAIDQKITRRLSRIVLKKKKSTELLKSATHGTGLVLPSDTGAVATSAGLGSTLGTSLGLYPSSLGPSSSHGPPQFLRIKIADTADAGHVSTTIQASGGMYMAEVLEAVCLKRRLNNPKDYALVLDLGSTKLFIPLDRTVKSLQGKRDLILIKNSMLQNYGVDMGKRNTARSTDPNASIFKRASEIPDQSYTSLFDYPPAYRRYTVYRKVPMLVTRSARILAIDGGYIHIMPHANKAKNVFESGKTTSYDIKSVVAVQHSGKNSATFKLVVPRDGERHKRYEFEAETPKLAAEIVQTIRNLKQALDRSGTTKQARRSKHVS